MRKIGAYVQMTTEQYHLALDVWQAHAAAFDEALLAVKATMEASEAEMQSLRFEALRLSQESPLTAVQAVQRTSRKRFPDYPFRSPA